MHTNLVPQGVKRFAPAQATVRELNHRFCHFGLSQTASASFTRRVGDCRSTISQRVSWGVNLMSDAEGWTIPRSRLASVVESRGRDVGVAEPFLHLGYIGLMGKCVGGRRRAQECTHNPFTWVLTPVSSPYFCTMLR